MSLGFLHLYNRDLLIHKMVYAETETILKILSHVLTLKLIMEFICTYSFSDHYMECHKAPIWVCFFFHWKSVRMLLVLRYSETVY